MNALKSLIKRGYDDLNIRKMFEDFDEPLFTDFWLKPYETYTFKFVPKVDILEDKDNLFIKAEIPGVRKEDVKVTLTENTITLSGEKKKEFKEERHNYYRIERSEGLFTRSFTLPKDVKGDKIKAEFRDGILDITLPKVEEVKKMEKEIEIR